MELVSVKAREGGTVMDAHKQWATRPADEAVFSAAELVSRTKAIRAASRAKDGVEWASLSAHAVGDDLAIVGKGGVPAYLTNWSLSQLSGAVGAPASYLSRLPADLAAAALNHGLRNDLRRDNDASVLLSVADPARPELRAILTDRYERVWDEEIASRVDSLCSRGGWGPAEAFRSANVARVSHAWGKPAPLPLGWVGDRSTFVLLVDYDGVVVTPEGQKMARFLTLANSEVGGSALVSVFGLLDFVCGNMILWGCSNVFEARWRHTKAVRERLPALSVLAENRLGSGDKDDIVSRINAARGKLLGDDQDAVVNAVSAKTKIPKKVVVAAYGRVEATPRYGDPRSVWGIVQGLTEESQSAEHFDERQEIDRAASKLLASF